DQDDPDDLGQPDVLRQLPVDVAHEHAHGAMGHVEDVGGGVGDDQPARSDGEDGPVLQTDDPEREQVAEHLAHRPLTVCPEQSKVLAAVGCSRTNCPPWILSMIAQGDGILDPMSWGGTIPPPSQPRTRDSASIIFSRVTSGPMSLSSW